MAAGEINSLDRECREARPGLNHYTNLISTNKPSLRGVANATIMDNNQLTFRTEAEYESAMDEIHDLMRKGEDNLTEEEMGKLGRMAIAAEAYEDMHFPFPPLKPTPAS